MGCSHRFLLNGKSWSDFGALGCEVGLYITEACVVRKGRGIRGGKGRLSSNRTAKRHREILRSSS